MSLMKMFLYSACVGDHLCDAAGLENEDTACRSDDGGCLCAEGYSGTKCLPMSKCAL